MHCFAAQVLHLPREDKVKDDGITMTDKAKEAEISMMSRQPAEDGKEQDQAVGDASFELVESADADDHSIRMVVDDMIKEI